MALPMGDWPTHQLTEFLAAISSSTDEPSALRGAAERAAEALEAEVAGILLGGSLVASVGFPAGSDATAPLLAVASGVTALVPVPGLGSCHAVAVPLEHRFRGSLVLARTGDDGFGAEERNLLRGMARVLSLTLRMIERQKLLERLARIQRSISHRAPLGEVLDTITAGAAELIGDEVVGLRLLDPEDPDMMLTASTSGVRKDLLDSILRTPVKEGVGGRAVLEDDLVVVVDYEHEAGMIPVFAADHLQAAMAAPVRENGRVVGSLTVATYRPGRTYSDSEKEALVALAEHTSIALTDAKTLEAMREAQRSKEMFLAMVSHELKTPLTVIMGTLRTVQARGDDLPPAIRDEILGAAYQRGRELEQLIHRLLQGARAELAGVREDVHLFSLLRSVIAGFASSRRLSLVHAVPEVTLSIDPSALREILGILLENAVAHSPQGTPITIEVVLEAGDVAITVANQGSLPDDLDPTSIFMPFRRGAGARSPVVGLGLHIAARMADSMGARLAAASDAGCVHLTLAFAAIEVPHSRPQTAHRPEAANGEPSRGGGLPTLPSPPRRAMTPPVLQ